MASKAARGTLTLSFLILLAVPAILPSSLFAAAAFDSLSISAPFSRLSSRLPEAAPAPVPAAPASAKKAVVISIVGVEFTQIGIGKLDLDYFKKIIEHFMPGKEPDGDLFSAGISRIGEEEAMSAQYRRFPDDYLDGRLAQVLPGESYEVVPVRWSRDPDESEAAVPILEDAIKKVFKAARAEDRPVYLVAHSWGTILAHTVLKKLAVSDPEIHIDKFITMGSPLVPGYWWLDIFMKAQINSGQLQSYVSKPANTGYWVNLWARKDIFSNEIDAADKNVQTDGWTARMEEHIRYAAETDPSLWDDAKRDLFFLYNLKTWHFAYIYDFHLFFRSLKKDYEKLIFEPAISAELPR
ncbi:MAG: hypothetical protein PHV36_08815 [Elusimicrobiales bacterium]|nr:hypothetical protein [Elusimicrobiales bacterium]